MWDYETRRTMGFFSSRSEGTEQGRSSAQGGNGNVRDTRHTAAGKHSAISTPALQAVRDLHTGRADYTGKHRAK
jgi:hypothetical protein